MVVVCLICRNLIGFMFPCAFGLIISFSISGEIGVVQDYYKIMEVDYDAKEDEIRSSYIRLALVSACRLLFQRVVIFEVLISGNL